MLLLSLVHLMVAVVAPTPSSDLAENPALRQRTVSAMTSNIYFGILVQSIDNSKIVLRGERSWKQLCSVTRLGVHPDDDDDDDDDVSWLTTLIFGATIYSRASQEWLKARQHHARKSHVAVFNTVDSCDFVASFVHTNACHIVARCNFVAC